MNGTKNINPWASGSVLL